MDLTTLLLLFLLCVVLYFWHQEKSKCDLPGPWTLPLVGFAPFMGRNPHKRLAKLAKTYGNVFQLRIGVKRVVVLNSYETIKEALTRWQFSDRPDEPGSSFHYLKEINNGIGISFFSVDERWLFIRKSAVRALNHIPDNRLQELTFKAIHFLTENFKHWPAQGKYPVKEAFLAVNSVIGPLTYGQTFKSRDIFMETLMSISKDFSIFSVGSMLDYFPFLRPFLRKNIAGFFAKVRTQQQLVAYFVENHKFNPEIVDIQDELEAHANSENCSRLDVDIRFVSRDLFFAGTFAMMEHLLFFLRLCAIFPEIQENLREEINRICPEKHVTLEFQHKMPYLRALTEEMFRFFSHVPLAITHCTQESLLFEGFKIPAKTPVLPNLWSVHFDPELFPNPEKFDPGRFLNESEEFDPKLAEAVIPFGIGKRKCVGESLARKELFLYMANLVKRFRIGVSWLEGEGPFDHRPGFVLGMKPAGLKFDLL